MHQVKNWQRSSVRRRVGIIPVVMIACLCQFTQSCKHSHSPPVAANFDPKKFVALMEEFITANSECESIVKSPTPPDEQSLRVTVYVDQSQSIRGFVPDNASDPFFKNSNFVELLRALGNQHEVQDFVGFGSQGAVGKEDEVRRKYGPVPPLKPEDYMLLNNNYSALIADMTKSKSVDHIFVMITDGQQSRQARDMGSLMGPTAQIMKSWIDSGGMVDLLLFTAPFKGKYFSEELRAQGKQFTFSVSEPRRPLLLFAFIPRYGLLNEWDSLLKRERMQKIARLRSYRLPQFANLLPSAAASPKSGELSMQTSKELGLVPRHNVPYELLQHLDSLDPPWSANIYRAVVCSSKMKGIDQKQINAIPVFVDCSAFGSLTDGKFILDTMKLNRCKPKLSVYTKSKNGISSGTDQAKAKSLQWKLVQERDLRFENPVIQTVEDSPKAVPTHKSQFCLRYMIPWTGNEDLICVFSLTSPEEDLEPPQFDDLSTTDDTNASQMNKVYNLQTLMEQLTKKGKKISRPVGFLLYFGSAT